MEEQKRLRELIEKSRSIVFFGGAGVSTESGIPDFRSEDGLYRTRWKYPPETILSHDFFLTRPGDFYEFYREKIAQTKARPNPAHLALARLEAASTRPRAAKPCGSCTEASTATTAWPVAGDFHFRMFLPKTACRTAPAAGSSARMWCSTARGLTRR